MLEEICFHPETSTFSEMMISDNCMSGGGGEPTKQLLFPKVGGAEPEVANGVHC